MIYLAVSFTIFIATVFFHLLIFRINRQRRSILVTLIIYLSGFILELFTVFYLSSVLPAGWTVISLPYSGITFYLLLCVSYLICISSVILRDLSPSNTIIETLLTEGKASEKKLIDKLIAGNIIEKRLSEMVGARLIQKNKNRYKIAAKGGKVAKLFIFYRELYKWDRGG